jgi:O-antigen/teichoic acid export membrane protein
MAERFARQSALNFVAGIATTSSGFLSTILVARLLGVEGTGVVAFATWIITVTIVVTDLGLAGTLTRFLPELHARGDDQAASSLTRYLLRRQLLILAGMLACFATYALVVLGREEAILPVQSDTYLRSVAFWAIVAAAAATQGLASFIYGFLKGTQSFSRLAAVAAIGGVLQIGTTLIGGSLFGVPGAMGAAVLGHIAAACLILTVRSRGGEVGAELKKRVNRFALASWANYIVAAFAWSRMELFFLERSWGSEATGLFSVSLTLANLATQTPLLLTGALLPYMAQHTFENGGQKARDAYVIGMRLMAFIIFPACFGTAAIAPTLLPLFFGPDFAPAVPTAVVLVSTAAFSASASVAVTYLFAVERTSVVLVTGLVGAGLSIVVGMVIVPVYGPMAAAIGRGAIQILIVAVAVLYIHNRLNCPAPYGALARLLAAAVLCGATASLVVWHVPGGVGLAAAITAGACVYILAIRLFGGLSRHDADRLAAVVDTTLPSSLNPIARTMLGVLQPLHWPK